MEHNGRLKKCYYALLACILNPNLTISKSQEIFDLKEADFADGTTVDRAERARQQAKTYYYAHREQVIARQKAYRERMRGRKND